MYSVGKLRNFKNRKPEKKNNGIIIPGSNNKTMWYWHKTDMQISRTVKRRQN